ncbi:MAG: hypothetical protein WB812_13630, partial [Woeseiaceae bacterium]
MGTFLRAAVLGLALTTATASAAAGVAGYESTAGGLAVELDGGRLQLTVCSERAVRVQFMPEGGAAPAPSLAVAHPCAGFDGYTVRE